MARSRRHPPVLDTMPAPNPNRTAPRRGSAFMAAAVAAIIAGAGTSPGQVASRDNFRDWAIYRGDSTGVQFSQLDQITAANVHRLEVAWEYHHGNPSGPSIYSNPIVVGGRLYFTTPTIDAVALDAATGEELWVFRPADHAPGNRVFRGRNRGLVHWEDEDGRHGRIFNFVKDRVFALDAATGRLVESFGDGGSIDLREHLPVPASEASIEVTTPGIVFRDLLIVGSRVPEGNESTPGDIRAFDARTGAFRWIFHTVPREGEFGHGTWKWEEGTTYGGANPWGGFTLDRERGWVFCATGCAAGDFIYGGSRKGENLFANCVLALDAATGRRIWHYQTIHHDIWDYDNPPAPILATIPDGHGGGRDVAIQMTKMGFVFVLDRDTGEPVFPVEERPVPPSRVPGEEAWPTQPIPVRPPPLVRQAIHEADLTRVTPEAHRAALAEFRKFRTGPLYTPASLEGTITTPGHLGGVEWGGGAFDPATGVLYVNANESPTVNRLVPLDDPGSDPAAATPASRGAALFGVNCTFCHGLTRSGNPPLYPPLDTGTLAEEAIRAVLRDGRGIMPAFPQLSALEVDDLVAFLLAPTTGAEAAPARSADPRGAGVAPRYAQVAPFFSDEHGVPFIAPPWGTLNAVDLVRGEILWKVPLGEYPHLAEQGIRHTGAKNFGGPVLTAGHLVFIAATPDEKIRAFDKFTGRVLWEHPLPAAGFATPATYEIDGRQFVVIACGGGGKLGTRHGDSVVAFALPKPRADAEPEAAP